MDAMNHCRYWRGHTRAFSSGTGEGLSTGPSHGPARGADAKPKFHAQDCAILMGSSASRAGVIANTKEFEVGKSQGYYKRNPGSDIAILQITRGAPRAFAGHIIDNV